MLCYNPTHNGDHSSVMIKESLRFDNVDGSIGDILTVPKRKREEDIEIAWSSSLNKHHDANVDCMYTTSPSHKRSASSSTRNSFFNISSCDTELRDGPVDYASLDEDYDSAALVSIIRRASPQATPKSLKNNDNNEDEKDNNSYPEFPTIARARTISDPTDEYEEFFLVESSSRLTSPPLEDLVLYHQDNDNLSADDYARYEEKDTIRVRDYVDEIWLVSRTSSEASPLK